MSYASVPQFEMLVNGQALDADQLHACYVVLSEMARALGGDLLRRPSWLGSGAEISLGLKGDLLQATMSAGDVYLFEPITLEHQGLTAATASRQSERVLDVPTNSEVLLSLVPYEADARLGALVVTKAFAPPGATEPAAPVAGAVPIAWLSTAFTDARNVTDARPHVVTGVSVESGGDEIRSRKVYVPVTDARAAVVLRQGERLHVTIYADLQDGLIQEYIDNPNHPIPLDQIDMTQIELAFNGVVLSSKFATTRGVLGDTVIGCANNSPMRRSAIFEWIFDPFANAAHAEQIFQVAAGGTALVEVVASGLVVSINSMNLQLDVLPREVTL